MFKIKTITNIKDFYSIKNIWSSLLNQSIDNNIFLTWEWLYNWWQVFNKNKNLFIILLFLKDELITIAPLFTYLNKPYELNFIGSTNIGSDYLGIIIKKDYEQESLDFLFKFLLQNFYVLNLTDISSSSYLISFLKNSNYHYHLKQTTVCPYIKLPTSFHDYMNTLSNNMRYTIKRKRKKYINTYHGKYIMIKKTNENELTEYFNIFLKLNKERMSEKGIESPFNDYNFLDFHQRIIKSFAKNNWLQLSFLTINNEPIASLYNFQYNKRVYFYQSGFTSKWNKISPGVLLFSYSIENAINTGMEIFDFLKGDEHYKFYWTKDFTPLYNLKVFSKKINYLSYLIKYQLTNSLKHSIKKFIKKGGNSGK